MDRRYVRILVVDDYEPWRSFAISTLQRQPGWLIVGEASDGMKAVERAQELQPDLILLDIGLPTLNGIAAARRILKLAPNSQILFASENRSTDVVEEALGTGAAGYVVKSDAGSDLLPAVASALQNKCFVSRSLSGHPFAATPNPSTVRESSTRRSFDALL